MKLFESQFLPLKFLLKNIMKLSNMHFFKRQIPCSTVKVNKLIIAAFTVTHSKGHGLSVGLRVTPSIRHFENHGVVTGRKRYRTMLYGTYPQILKLILGGASVGS